MTATPKTPIRRPNATKAHTPKKEKFCSIGYQSPTDNSSREESIKKKRSKKRSKKIKISPKDAPSTPINWRHINGEDAFTSPLPHESNEAPNAPKKK